MDPGPANSLPLEVVQMIMLESMRDMDLLNSIALARLANVCTTWAEALKSLNVHGNLFKVELWINLQHKRFDGINSSSLQALRDDDSSVRLTSDKLTRHLRAHALAAESLFLRFEHYESRRKVRAMLESVLMRFKFCREINVQIDTEETERFAFWPIFCKPLANATKLTALTLHAPKPYALSDRAVKSKSIDLSRVLDVTFSGALLPFVHTPNAERVMLRKMEIGGPEELRRFCNGIRKATVLVLVGVKAAPGTAGEFGQVGSFDWGSPEGDARKVELSIKMRYAEETFKYGALDGDVIPDSDGSIDGSAIAWRRKRPERKRVAADLYKEEREDWAYRVVAKYVLSHARPWLKALRIDARVKSDLTDIVRGLGPAYSVLERIELWGLMKSKVSSDPDTVKLLKLVARMVAKRKLRPKDGIVFGGMGLTLEGVVSVVSRMRVSTKGQKAGSVAPVEFIGCYPDKVPSTSFRIHHEALEGVTTLTGIGHIVEEPARSIGGIYRDFAALSERKRVADYREAGAVMIRADGDVGTVVKQFIKGGGAVDMDLFGPNEMPVHSEQYLSNDRLRVGTTGAARDINQREIEVATVSERTYIDLT